MEKEIEKDLMGTNELELYKAISSLSSPEEASKLLRDLLTFDEIKEISNRFAVVKLLNNKVTVREIVKRTKTSSATVSRINFWLHHGTGGYRLVLQKLR